MGGGHRNRALGTGRAERAAAAAGALISRRFGGTPALCPTRGDGAFPVENGGDGPWQPNKKFGWGAVVTANGARWTRLQEGTTAASGSGPAGLGPEVRDGSTTWRLTNYAFGRPGSGQAGIVPVVATFPGSNVVLATTAGDPVWTGTGAAAARPDLMLAHDAAYFTRRTHLLPSYDLAVQVLPEAGSPAPYFPNTPSLYSDDTGNNPGDDRIGSLSHSEAHLLLCAFDPVQEVAVRRMAFSFLDFPGVWEDERTGRPVARTARRYPALIPNPGFSLGDWNGKNGSPAWQGTGAALNMYAGRYRPLMDGSHLPAPWVLPYLRTGHPAYAELGLAEAMAMLSSQAPDNRDPQIAGTTYENCVLGPYNQQIRGMGWGLRVLGLLDALMPEVDPMRALIRDVVAQNAAFASVYPATVDPRAARLGLLWTAASGFNDMSVFMHSFLAIGLAMEAWRGDHPGWATMLRAVSPATVGYWDEAQGGSGYYADAYALRWKTIEGADPSSAFPGIAAMLRANYPKAPPRPVGIFEDAGGGVPADDATLGAKYFQGEESFPGASTSYLAIALGALGAQAAAGVPRAAETYAALRRRLGTPPLKGVAFAGRDRNTGEPHAYVAFAIVPP